MEYDFKNIEKYIQMHSDVINTVYLGMKEDWWWTAEAVYEDGKVLVDFSDENLEIAGISGSYWATPLMEVSFKDGSEKNIEVGVGESTGEKPSWFELGCISQEVQDIRDGKYLEN